MNFLFLMDPLDTVIMEKDTSFILMLGAYRKKHTVHYLPDGGLSFKNGKLHFHTTEVVPQQNKEQPFITKGEHLLSEDQVDVIFIRSDPPFDAKYLFNTWLLDRVADKIPVINRPSGIRTANEKIWTTKFPVFIPRTVIGCDKSVLSNFLKDEKLVIAKPTDGFGGQSVFRIKHGDHNAKVILETLTAHWKTDIILQQYIPESDAGDKRILLLNGEPLGAVLRVHAPDDHRNNFFAGGKPAATQITKREEEIIRTLKPELLKLGLYFVGIDIIGDYLIEVNVTSPTGLQEISQFADKQLETQVVAFAEKLVDQFKTSDTIAT